MNKNPYFFFVDDDEEDQLIFKEALKRIDPLILLSTANDGQEALNIINSRKKQLPDYIFMDLNMAGMNGKTCIKEIKADKLLHFIPIIVYTTSGTKKDIDDCFNLGAKHFITKPTSITEIMVKIKEVIAMDLGSN